MNKLAVDLPNQTGVYLFKNKNNNVIYIGKAKNIKKRVSSYFVKNQPDKTQFILKEAVLAEYVITDSELEALLLECNLIKKHKPKYNVVLRDDKSYPYVAISGKSFPRVMITRRTNLKDTKYYGPFTAGSIKKTLEMLRKIFPFATCRNPTKGNHGKACLYYHIKQCVAPCINEIGDKEYNAIIRDIELFMQGKHRKIIKMLELEMRRLSSKHHYEKAVKTRDRLAAIKSISQAQKVISPRPYNADIIGIASRNPDWLLKVFIIREGKLIDVKDFNLSGITNAANAIRSFILQYYSVTSLFPAAIYLSNEIKDKEVIELWLKKKFDRSIKIITPKKGDKKRLVDMACENAQQSLVEQAARKAKLEKHSEMIIEELQTMLGLDNRPYRIECFDISCISGKHAVGSMVTFMNARPHKELYRKFKLRNAHDSDTGMMREVLERRFSKTENVSEKTSWGEPDLVIVDGGRAQLNVALKTIKEAGKKNIDCISLAKKKEEVYTKGSKTPIQLPDRSNAKYLIMRIRDEAHRFAVDYHRIIRQKNIFES